MRTISRSLALLALLAGSSSIGSEASAAPPVSASDPDVELRLAVSPPVWDTGTAPQLDLRFVNHRASDVRVVSPLDGSWEGVRSPNYSLELLDATGAVVPEALGPDAGRSCGLTNSLQPQDILSLGPGAQVSATHSPGSFPFAGVVGEAALPGDHRVRVRYRSDLPGATALELVSNAVPVKIRGGSEALWTCRRDQQRLAAKYRHSEVVPLDIGATTGGAAILFKQVEVTGLGGGARRSGSLYLQRLVDGAPRPALGLALADGLALARTVALDDGLLALYTVDARASGVGAQRLNARRVGGEAVSTPPGWTREIADAYHLGLARAGDSIGALYLAHGTQGASLLMYQPIGRDGAPIGEPRRLAAADHLSDPQLAADPRGLWASWIEGAALHVQSLADGAKPVVIHERLGAIDSLWPRAGGLALAYQKNSIDGRIHGDTMAFYLQRFDLTGAKQGPPVALSPTSRTDPHWGELAWGDGGATRAYVEQRRTTPQQDPVTLWFGPVDSAAQKLSDTAIGEARLVALGPEYVLAWSDARDDRSRSCLRIGACVGEVYVARWRPGDRSPPTPTRLTRLAIPRPPVGPEHRWRELCD